MRALPPGLQLKNSFLLSLIFWMLAGSVFAGTGFLPDSSGKKKKSIFQSMALAYPDRAGDFEENLFKDPQLLFNVSMMHSRYDLSGYFTDEWLLQENDLELQTRPNLQDPLRKFSQTRISMELSGSFLFFYAGLGLVLPETNRQISMGQGRTWYFNDSTRYFAEIRKGSYWKAGLNFHFRRWCIYGGLRGYQGYNASSVVSENLKSGKSSRLSGAGSGVFSNFFELGIRYQNFTFGFEKALNIDFSGPECNSFFVGYNIFDLRNFNEKRIPR